MSHNPLILQSSCDTTFGSDYSPCTILEDDDPTDTTQCTNSESHRNPTPNPVFPPKPQQKHNESGEDTVGDGLILDLCATTKTPLGDREPVVHSVQNSFPCSEQKSSHPTAPYPEGSVFMFGEDWNTTSPKYANLKDEVLNNEYASISSKSWDGVLKKSNTILKAGESTSFQRKRWSRKLRDKGIKLKHLLALKLYTDFDLLQREFRKTFRPPFNRDTERLQSFGRWKDLLEETFSRFNDVIRESDQPQRLFHGINTIMAVDRFSGLNCGPCSTTTDLHVARSFAGKNGMILVLRPERKSAYRVLDISWVSDYPDEREYLTFGHEVKIEAVILSTDYDRYYHYYHSILTKGDDEAMQKGPPDHLSYAEQVEISGHFDDFTKLFVSTEAGTQILDFGHHALCERQKISLFLWIMAVMDGRLGSMSEDFRQSVSDNLCYLMGQIEESKVPIDMMDELVTESKRSENEIRVVFAEYFPITVTAESPTV